MNTNELSHNLYFLMNASRDENSDRYEAMFDANETTLKFQSFRNEGYISNGSKLFQVIFEGATAKVSTVTATRKEGYKLSNTQTFTSKKELAKYIKS